MPEAILSSKHQLVIPKKIRQETGLKTGEKIIIIVKDGIINLIPQHILKKLRGFAKGINIQHYREEEGRI